MCRACTAQLERVLFTLWTVCVLPPGVVRGAISTKVQGPLCDSEDAAVIYSVRQGVA